MCIVKGCKKDAPSGAELCSDCYAMLTNADVEKSGTTFIANMAKTIEKLAQDRELLLVHSSIMYKASTRALDNFPKVKEMMDKGDIE